MPGWGYGKDEKSCPDGYIDPYSGKGYDGKPLEVMTMGF
jgi:hypothetical protein